MLSATNLFKAVSTAATNHQSLKKIIILKQIPRIDALSSTTPGLKPHLSKLYNDTLDTLASNCSFKNKLVIGNHDLDCTGGVLQARYRDSISGRYDGTHMFGPSGQKAYTASVMRILNSAQLVRVNPPKYYDQFDKQYNSTTNQENTNRRKNTVNSGHRFNQYSVPTHNRFTKLGDYFPGNY